MDNVTPAFSDMTTDEKLDWVCDTLQRLLTEFEPLLARARKRGKIPPAPMMTQKGNSNARG